MRRRIGIISGMIALALLTAQCISSPMQGVLVTSTEHTVHDRNTGNLIGNGAVEKRGESCSYGSVLLFPFFYGGGKSLEEAMKQGGISEIAIVDHSSLVVIGGLVFHRECIIVWGS